MGRGPEVFDCWGLARHVLVRGFGLPVPVIEYASTEAGRELLRRGAIAGWEEVCEEIPGDVGLFHVHGQPAHVGVAIGDGQMIHVVKGQTSAIARYKISPWRQKLEGFYRWTAIE